jgi:hypothetical protein
VESWHSRCYSCNNFYRRVKGKRTVLLSGYGSTPYADGRIGGDLILDPSGTVLARLWRKRGRYFFDHYDLLGSTTATLYDGGSMLNRYEFTAYGDVESEDDIVHNGVKYAGHPIDTTTGFTYMNARYYEPSAACGITCAARRTR